MKTKFALLGVSMIGLIWAQNQIHISSTSPTVAYSLTEIQKVTFAGSNTVIYFVGGSSSSIATVGQKWTFASSDAQSSAALSSSSGNLSSSSSLVAVAPQAAGAIRYQIQSGILSVQVDQKSTFSLLRMNGQLLSQSLVEQNAWTAHLLSQEHLILRIQNSNTIKNYLLQMQK